MTFRRVKTSICQLVLTLEGYRERRSSSFFGNISKLGVFLHTVRLNVHQQTIRPIRCCDPLGLAGGLEPVRRAEEGRPQRGQRQPLRRLHVQAEAHRQYSPLGGLLLAGGSNNIRSIVRGGEGHWGPGGGEGGGGGGGRSCRGSGGGGGGRQENSNQREE